MNDSQQGLGHLIPGAVFLAVGVLAASLAAADYGLIRSGGRTGAGFVPVLASAALALLGLAQTVRGIRSLRAAGQGRGDLPSPAEARPVEASPLEASAADARAADARAVRAHPEGPAQPPEQRGRVAMLTGLLVACLIAVPILGHFASFAILVAVMTSAVERRPWIVGLASGLLAGGFAWLVFDLFLGIPMTGGLLL